MSPSTPQTRWLLIPLTMVLIGYAYDLGGYPLLEPDEGRNAAVALAMAEQNDYLVPRLNGMPYVDKPVLFFATTAAAMKMFGTSALAARLASLFFTLGTLVVVTRFGQRLFDRETGILAAVATAAAPLTLAFSRTVIFDATLTFFVVSAIAALYSAVEADRDSNVRHRAILIGWVAMALGVLTKGPIAIGVPLMIAFPYAVWRHRVSRLFDLVALLAFVAVVLPWVAVMSNAAPDYLEYVLLTETVRRFATDELRRTGPWWYFIPILMAGAAPWSILVLGNAMRRARAFFTQPTRDPRTMFLLLWIVVPLLFFSLSQSKRVQYILPIIPAIAIAAAHILRGTVARPVRWGSAAVLALVAAVLWSAPVIVRTQIDTSEAVRAAIPFVSVTLGTVTLLAGGALLGRHRAVMITMLALPTAIIPLISTGLMAAIGATRSSRELAQSIDEVTSPQTEIVGVHAFPLSLPFYLGRGMTLSTHDGRELTSNYLVAHLADWSGPGNRLRNADWWLERLGTCATPAVFVVRRDDSTRRPLLAATLPLIGENRKHSAYGPCAPGALATAPN